MIKIAIASDKWKSSDSETEENKSSINVAKDSDFEKFLFMKVDLTVKKSGKYSIQLKEFNVSVIFIISRLLYMCYWINMSD